MNTRRIVVIGFMACGKTTVGQEVARRLDCKFVDLDSFITERFGRTPAELIQQNGEASFRETETLALRDVLQEKNARVIALGGGAWTIPANRTLVALHDCASVWLDAPFELCWERIKSSQAVRPLAPNREAALSRFQSRRDDYALADRSLPLGARDTPEKVAEQILREI